MIEPENVSLETDHLEEVIETPPPAQPVVVIQYRNRGVPWYVVIGLLAGFFLLGAAYYHRAIARRRMYDPPPQTTLPAAVAQESTPATSAAALPVPLALNLQPIAPGSLTAMTPAALPAHAEAAKPGAPASTAKPEPKPANPATIALEKPKPSAESPRPATEQPKPISEPAKPKNSVASIFAIPVPPRNDDNPFAELDIARGPSPAARAEPAAPAAANPPAAPAADDRPTPTAAEMLQDIKAEAAEKRQERNQLRNMKEHARDDLAAQAMDRTEEERAVFRRELGEILKAKSPTAGQEINDLCDKYGRNYDAALHDKAVHALALSSGRLSTDAKMNILRRYGVPEPGILDYIANEIAHNQMRSRNGPKTPDQVRVLAARQLLSARLPRNRSSTGGTVEPTEGPRAARPGGGVQGR